jgi:hypothetical protein
MERACVMRTAKHGEHDAEYEERKQKKLMEKVAVT